LFRERFDELTLEKELLDLGIRSEVVGNAAVDPNVFEPIIAMHQTDKNAFNLFMENLQRQVSLGFDVVQVLRVLLHNRMRALDFYGKIVSLFLLCCCITLW